MNEADIPIDIQTNKLQDWLISRRHVKKDWHKFILPIREKINNAIQDMPAHHGIANLLSGSHINYFHCLKIIEILKETEADTKNLFGRYGSQRMKDWQEIVKLYEKDNIYLAEAASILVRNVNYEVTSLKKQIQKFEQLQSESDKKATDYAKKESASKGEFNTVCKQMGISGDKIKSELIEKLNEIPDLYEKIGQKAAGLKPAIELFKLFTKCIINEQFSLNCLPLLMFIVERGNTTVYEWTYGEPPLSIEPDPILITLDDEKIEDNQESGEIVFDDLDMNTGEIDFGEMSNENAEIEWGDLGNDSKIEPLDDIDFNISLEESGIVVDDSGHLGGIAKGKEALTLLDSPNTRSDFIDQLFELEAFLKMRLYELSTNTQYSAFSTLQDLPIESSDSIASMLTLVQILLTEMTEKKIDHLHNIKHSPKYVDTLVTHLKQKIVVCNKMKDQIEVMKTKKEEARVNASKIVPVLNLIIEKSKELHIEIEKDISKKYHGRIVNLTGGVKVL